MHEKSVFDGSSGRGFRGSDRPFVRLWNRVGKQRRFGAYTAPLWSPLVVCPLVLVLSCLILCWLLSRWSSFVLAVCGTVQGSSAVSEHGLLPSGLLLSCVPWSYLVVSCAGICRFGLLLSWLLLSSSSVVASDRVPCCLVFSSLGPSVLSLGASWKPLRRLWEAFFDLREAVSYTHLTLPTKLEV